MRRLILLISIMLFAFPLSAFAATATVEKTVNFRSAPKTGSSIYGYIKPGTKVNVLDEVNDWWLKIEYNGRTGYVSTGYMSNVTSGGDTNNGGVYETKVIWGVNFRAEPSASAYKYRLIPTGEDIHVIEKQGSWLKIQVQDGTVGYISSDSKYTNYKSTTPDNSNEASATGSQIVATAKKYLGDFKYKWGAEPWTTNNKYSDCSAFVQLVFTRNHGYDLPRSSIQQSKEGSKVSKSDLRIGDLVFFDTDKDGDINHVGIYIGNGEFIHSSPINEVGINNLNTGYWKDRYETARRVL